MTIKYGLAVYDRSTNMVGCDITLPMDDVVEGNLHEFLSSAGENGWELCGSFSCGVKGMNRAIGSKGEVRKCEDTTEEIAFIFKHVE